MLISFTKRTYREIQVEIKALEEQADALEQQMIREMDARNAESLTPQPERGCHHYTPPRLCPTTTPTRPNKNHCEKEQSI